MDPRSEGLSNKELSAAIEDKIRNGNLSQDEQEHLEYQQDLLRAAHEAEIALKKTSEWAGDFGGQKFLESQRCQVISGYAGDSPDGHVSQGRGEVGQVGISGPDITPPDAGKSAPWSEHYEIVFQVNEGGDVSEPRLETFKGAQQGSLRYLTYSLNAQNPNGRFLNDLRQLKITGQYPGFFKALEQGEVRVRYQYANTRTDGTLRSGAFDLGGEVRLQWDGNNTFKLITQESS